MEIKIKASLQELNEYNNEYISNIIGEKNDNIITYKDDNVLVSLVIDKQVKLIRENDDYKAELVFDNNKSTVGTYLLKDTNTVLPIKIDTKKMIINDNYMEIIYKLNTQDNQVKFEVSYEVIS